MPNQPYWDDVKEGDSIPELVKNCDSQRLVLWAAGSGDFNQIHYDERIAKSQKLEDRTDSPTVSPGTMLPP